MPKKVNVLIKELNDCYYKFLRRDITTLQFLQHTTSRTIISTEIEIIPSVGGKRIREQEQQVGYNIGYTVAPLTFTISFDKIIAFITAAVSFVRDPFAIAAALQPLEQALARELPTLDTVAQPRYFIKTFYGIVPGSPVPGSAPVLKKRLLGTVLSTFEKAQGINIFAEEADIEAAIFCGAIDYALADEFVKAGNVFRDGSIAYAFVHGQDIHRIGIQALINSGILEQFEISPKQLLELLINVKQQKSNFNLWQYLLDSTVDLDGENLESIYTPPIFFTAKNPFTFSAWLRSFGHELGVPLLRNYLLDHYYRQIFKSVAIAKLNYPTLHSIDDEQLFDGMVKIAHGDARYLYKDPFKLTPYPTAEDLHKSKAWADKYHPLAGAKSENIAYKKSPINERPYANWTDYMQRFLQEWDH